MASIKDEVKKLPESPGVYMMRNEADEIIYVGKAVNLRRRVAQYFQESGKRSKKIEQMIASIDHFTWQPADTELEALILESNLIKRCRPRYNSALRKDENHPYVRIDMSDSYPRLTVYTDNIRRTKEICIGPYYRSMDMEKTVETVSHVFGLRTCGRSLAYGREDGHACLQFALGNCSGACRGNIPESVYAEQLAEAVDYLKGYGRHQVHETLQRRMEDASRSLNFEMAAHIRNRLQELQETDKRLRFKQRDGRGTVHLWAFAGNAEKESYVTALLYMIHGSNLSGRDCFRVQSEALYGRENGWSRFLEAFYKDTPFIPTGILIANEIDRPERLEKYVSDIRGEAACIYGPQGKEQKRLAALAAESAQLLHCR